MTGIECLLEQVYRATVQPIIPTIFERTKATCFAYGQTGTLLTDISVCSFTLHDFLNKYISLFLVTTSFEPVCSLVVLF